MSITDKNITCRDCSQQFVFTASEQAFFAEKGFGDPVRCLACRRALKAKKQAGEAPSFGDPRGGPTDFRNRDRGPRPPAEGENRPPQPPAEPPRTFGPDRPRRQDSNPAPPDWSGGGGGYPSDDRPRRKGGGRDKRPRRGQDDYGDY